MSWLDRINTDLTITCGDGKSYTPQWINASKAVEYNIAEFDFKELAGTLVYRGQPRGRRYAIEVIFQGADHLDNASAFETSANNPAAWQIEHPYYGQLRVQPAGLVFDNQDMNISRITGMLIETLTLNGATAVSVSAPDKIAADQQSTSDVMATVFASDVPDLKVVDQNALKSSSLSQYKAVSAKIIQSADAAAYFNAYNELIGKINNPISDTVSIIRAVHAFSVLPYRFSDLLVNRINMFKLQFDIISNNLGNLFTRTSKKIYENQAGIIVSGMALTSVTNVGDAYETVTGVLPVIDALVNTYDQYMTNLDSLQSPNGGDPDSYIPDADGVSSLSDLISFTVGALLDIAVQSKQERSIILGADSNIILLAKRFYGLDNEDTTIDKFMATNNIGLNEILEIKKGRKIVYYI